MHLIFLYGQAAAGKLTVARALSARTGFALFHNHLIVDAVGAVFPFGSDEFVRLREAFWMEMIGSAIAAGRALIFTFAPEPTVASDFPARVAAMVRAAGGAVMFVSLTLDPDEQERRIVSADRAAFGKLRSAELLRELRAGFAACMEAMPVAAITIDTSTIMPDAAAAQIAEAIAQQVD
ncbi:shikimate kinase [Sphingobium aromaticiconvertens]|uniref:shikimate kinase n=1 Tax=Sphingobium aromaticiconvertens TaxID=365341 RepID=UPI00301A5057